MFPIQSFLGKLNEMPFVEKASKELLQLTDWHLTSPLEPDKPHQTFFLTCGNYWLSIGVSRRQVVTVESDRIDAQEAVLQALVALSYDGFFKKENRQDLIPTSVKAVVFIDQMGRFLELLETDTGHFVPIIKFPHLRFTFFVDFDFENETAFLSYFQEEIVKISTKEEAEIFFEMFTKDDRTFEDILRRAVLLCQKIDNASFLYQGEKKWSICCFASEMVVRFSYHPNTERPIFFHRDNMTYSLHLYETNEKIEEASFSSMKALEEWFLAYMEHYIQKKKLKAVLAGNVNNYLYRVCHHMVGFHDDYTSFTHYRKCDENEIKRYLHHHFNEKLLMDDHRFKIELGPYLLHYGLNKNTNARQIVIEKKAG